MFKTEVRLLPLGVCDMVLGVKCMKEVGPITMDLNALSIMVLRLHYMLSPQRKASLSSSVGMLFKGTTINGRWNHGPADQHMCCTY